ncbi:hypothetical protein KFE25_006812 [Diacronema lutheri]|uniref:Nicotinate-nucleotide pyrophosphorylase [carboxylating] n=1 Tax=Diacronema lutheri TaxID=2081491 RepID=A0A8J5XTR3_DIALT|nr:hypothetical protein KFE25_006812 [Diacronema lutheri]
MASEDAFVDLLPTEWKASVHAWLKEDTPAFDVGGFVVGNKPEVAHLFAKSPGMLCGVPFVDAVFEICGCEVEWHMREGSTIELRDGASKVHVATVRGPARKLLLGERTALNTLSRASGVATRAHSAVQKARAAGWAGAVAGTRKTTPGFRLVEKYALLVAGADTHRYDLSHMVMLKDNHVWSCGSITQAVAKARRAAGFSTKIEVEARTLAEGLEAAAAGADIVMLDNFEADALKAAAAELKRAHPHVLIEASGGITVDNLTQFASVHVDIISKSYHQGYDVVDFSLKIMPGAR